MKLVDRLEKLETLLHDCAVVHGVPGAALAVQQGDAIYEAATGGHLERARDLQASVQRIFEAMFGAADFPEGFRIALELRGIRTGRGRQPLSPQQEREREGIRDSLAKRLGEEGVL